MKINSKIILAVPKGRIAKEIISLLSSLNLDPEKDFFEDEKNRKLLFKTKTKNFFLTKVRNFDVPTIVAFGGADFGIVGSDVVNEFDYEEIYSPIDLKLGKCSMVLAKNKNQKIDPDASIIKVASKYPIATQNFFENNGIPYYFFDAMGWVIEGSVDPLRILNNQGMTSIIDNNELVNKRNWYLTESFNDIAVRLNSFGVDDGHPGKEAHSEFSNTLYKNIMEIIE